MNWDRIVEQLELILTTPVRRNVMSPADWSGAADRKPTSGTMVKDRMIHFRLQEEDQLIHVLTVEEGSLTDSEIRLVELLIESGRVSERRHPAPVRSEEERRARQVGGWLLQQLDNGRSDAEIPESMALAGNLYTPKIPILFSGEYSDDRKVAYRSLKKLLDSFFEIDVILIPLSDKEWLILGNDALLSEQGKDEGSGEESPEEALASLCSGLYDMLTSEWLGECHVSIYHPVIPVKQLLSAVALLRETIALGRTYYMGASIHLPWTLHLEKLLHLIPETGKQRFLEQMMKGADRSFDTETLQTLEQFFELDCNVSETAKKLYIHRNTLLYRLDRLKQETGLDVRSFKDAVLMRIFLLLYKVTKRN